MPRISRCWLSRAKVTWLKVKQVVDMLLAASADREDDLPGRVGRRSLSLAAEQVERVPGRPLSNDLLKVVHRQPRQHDIVGAWDVQQSHHVDGAELLGLFPTATLRRAAHQPRREGQRQDRASRPNQRPTGVPPGPRGRIAAYGYQTAVRADQPHDGA
jgi:hypothetical protein